MDKRERLEKELEDLKATLTKCFEKRILTDDPEKEAKIQQKEQELAQLSDTPLDKNRSALNLEEGLCSLDFDKPQAIVRDILTYLSYNEGGSALFIMENCLEMEGSLLLRRVRDLLKSNTSQFFEYPVRFVPTLPANEVAFLKILGSHLGITVEEAAGDEPEKLAEAIEAIIKKITILLRSGTTILIPLANWKSLSFSGQVTFMEWFINQFWRSLTNAVTEAMQDYSPRVFCVIMVDELIADTCRKVEYFCEFEVFDCGKMLMLPLRCWTKTDVQRWLGSYSSKLTKSERNRLVEYIFGSKDEELPLKVRIELEKAHAQSIF